MCIIQRETIQREERKKQNQNAFDQFSKWQRVDSLSLVLFSGTHIKCIFFRCCHFQLSKWGLLYMFFYLNAVEVPIIFHCKIIAST